MAHRVYQAAPAPPAEPGSVCAPETRLGQLLTRLGLGSGIARDTAWSFALKISSTGLWFLVTVMLARLLGVGAYGTYAYAYALVTLLAIPAQAGLPNLVVRETARAMARCQPELAQGVWRWAGRITGLLSMALVLLVGGMALVWRRGPLGTQGLTMAWALALVPLVSLGNLRGAALRGLHRVVAGQLPEFVIRPGLFLLLLGSLTLATGGQLTAPQAMALHVLAAAIAFGAGAWLLWRKMPPRVRQVQPRFEGRTWLASTVPLALIAGMQVINQQADILMLGVFEPPVQVGIYRVAVQVAALASFALEAVNVVVAPHFARLYARGEVAHLQRVVTASARVVLAFNLAVTSLFVLVGKPLLGLVFGPAFVASYGPLMILLGGQFVNAAAGSVGFLLNMTGHERETARGMAASAVLNVVLNLMLIPLMGTKGAAIATAASLVVWNVLLWWAVRKRLGILSLAFDFGVRRRS